FSSPFPYTTLFRSCTPRFTRAISQSSSGVRQHAVQAAGILGADVVRLPQVALPLGRLLGEDVAAVGVAGLELAGRGLAESLGRTAMGLDLGHCGMSFRFLSLAWAVATPRFPSCPDRSCATRHQGGGAVRVRVRSEERRVGEASRDQRL